MTDVELVFDPLELPSSTNINIAHTDRGKPKVTLDLTHSTGSTKVAWDPKNAIKIGRAIVIAGQEALRGELVLPSNAADEIVVPGRPS